VKVFTQHCFNDADLAADYDQIKREKDIDNIIYLQATGKDKAPASKVQFKEEDENIQMNQKQMIKLYKVLYDYDKVVANDKKKDKLSKGTLKNLDNDDDGLYADFYKRMKEMADDKKLSDKAFREILTKRSKGETDYKIWLAKKNRSKEKFKITDRLHNERHEKDYIKAKIAREKEMFEEDEAIEMAHKYSDKHVYNYQVRSVDQFMDDQIYFQQRKLDRIRQLQDEKEIFEESLHP